MTGVKEVLLPDSCLVSCTAHQPISRQISLCRCLQEEPRRRSPSTAAWNAFEGAGTATCRGPTWTTSALFREILPEIKYYRERGFLSVDMESAAIWAVCRYRGADAATVHHVDGYLSNERRIDPEERDVSLVDRLEPTVEALEAHVG